MNWYLAALKKYAVFSGRETKKEYWMFMLFNTIFFIVVMILEIILVNTFNRFSFLTTLYALAVCVPILAATVRRLHDIGKRGRWIFISFIPIVGSIWLLVLLAADSQSGTDQPGLKPEPVFSAAKSSQEPVPDSVYSAGSFEKFARQAFQSSSSIKETIPPQTSDAKAANDEIKLLIADLKDESKRDSAIEALVKIGAPAGDLLMNFLEDNNRDARSAAAKTLERIGIPYMEQLIQSTKDADQDLRRKAAATLCKIDSDKAMASVLVALADDDYNVRFSTLFAMNGARPDSEDLQARMPGMETSLPANDTESRARLHCGLGRWLRKSLQGWPAAEQEFRESIKLMPQSGLPHTLLGDLLMCKSSNLNLENQMDQSRRVHDEAKQELETAIRLYPNDPTPYYAFCNSWWIDINKLKKLYLQAVKLDQARSVFFGDYHWEFAMKAAEKGSLSESQDAFRRAMVASPSEFESGMMSVRPSGGIALSCWNEARATISSYRDDDRKMDALWLAARQNALAISNSPLASKIRDLFKSKNIDGLREVARLEGNEVTELLVDILDNDPDPHAKLMAIDSLGLSSDPRSVSVLMAVFEHSGGDYRKTAAYSLANIVYNRVKSPDAIPSLTLIAKDTSLNKDVRCQAIYALSQFRNEDIKVGQFLAGLAQDENEDESIRFAAFEIKINGKSHDEKQPGKKVDGLIAIKAGYSYARERLISHISMSSGTQKTMQIMDDVVKVIDEYGYDGDHKVSAWDFVELTQLLAETKNQGLAAVEMLERETRMMRVILAGLKKLVLVRNCGVDKKEIPDDVNEILKINGPYEVDEVVKYLSGVGLV